MNLTFGVNDQATNLKEIMHKLQAGLALCKNYVLKNAAQTEIVQSEHKIPI